MRLFLPRMNEMTVGQNDSSEDLEEIQGDCNHEFIGV